MQTNTPTQVEDLPTEYKYGWKDDDTSINLSRGLNEDVVRAISDYKNEPQWMLRSRLKALKMFFRKPLPDWGANLGDLDFDNIKYFVPASQTPSITWDEVPEQIRDTYNKLGIRSAEQERLIAGITAQYDSTAVYHQIQQSLSDQGVIFTDMDTGLKEYPEIVENYFGSVIPPGDNKFAALNTACWSGGSFLYVPPGVHVDIPLQAYFRINSENMGQFERTLIIADEGSFIQYVEGCTAPVYSTQALHSAVVEIIAKKNAHVRYTTIQNWSNDVYNLVTKRATAAEGALVQWTDANIGCLAQGSTVTTPSGVKPIEFVTPGEKVLSYDEKEDKLLFKTVLAKQYSGIKPVREVSIGERRLLATDNHPFYSYTYDASRGAKSGRYNLDYVRVDNLTQPIFPISSIDYGISYKIPPTTLMTNFTTSNQHAKNFAALRNRKSRVTLPEYTTEDIMWLLGLYLGDGSIRRKAGVNEGIRYATVTFSVPVVDRAHEKLVAVMKNIIPNTLGSIRKDKIAISWNSVELAEFFEEMGFSGNAHTKKIPEWVINTPQNQRLAFVAGYLDSDGCIPASNNHFSLKSVNKEILKAVSRLLTSLGITSRLYTEFDEERQVQIRHHLATAKASYRLSFRTDERFTDYLSPMLQELLAKNKYAKNYYRKIGRSNIVLSPLLEIRTARISSEQIMLPTWDIQIEDTGNFISEGFIVHNSHITSKYPSVFLLGEHARGETLSLAMASTDQHQDTGAKMIHAAPHTSSSIVSKSVSRGGGRTSYRGLVQVLPGASHAASTVVCDALLVDSISRSDTYPYVDIREDDASMGHEATVSKINEEQLFYLMSRGMSETESRAMIVRGFIEPVSKELPMEFALELNTLVNLQMTGAVG